MPRRHDRWLIRAGAPRRRHAHPRKRAHAHALRYSPADGWRGRCGRRRRSSAAKSRTRSTPRRCTGVLCAAVRQHSICTRTRTNKHTQAHTDERAHACRCHGGPTARGSSRIARCRLHAVAWLHACVVHMLACGTLRLVGLRNAMATSHAPHAPGSTCTTQRAPRATACTIGTICLNAVACPCVDCTPALLRTAAGQPDG